MPISDQAGGVGADAFFLLVMELRPLEELKLEHDLLGRRCAAVRPHHPSRFCQTVQVAADGHIADAQFLREELDGAGAPLSQKLFELALPARLHLLKCLLIRVGLMVL